MPTGILPVPVTHPDKHPPFISLLTSRSHRSLRLVLVVLASFALIAWSFRSFSHRSVLEKLDSPEYAPLGSGHDGAALVGGQGAGAGEYESPPFIPADRLDLSPNARAVRALLNYVTHFPSLPLPVEVLDDGADVANVLREEARRAGEHEFDEGGKERPLVVFSKTYCPFSKKAKSLLVQLRLSPPPAIVEADLRSDTAILKSLLSKLTNHSTFPNVFIGGHSIGGSDDLQALHEQGKLWEVLRGAGVSRLGPAGK